MTEELEKTVGDINVAEKLNSILSWVEETAKTAEAFAIEQTPLYIQELLAWNFWMSLIFWCVFFVIPLAFALFLIVLGVKEVKKEDGEADFFGPCFAISVFSIIISIVGFCSNLEWLQITVAPRVFLMEYVSSKL